MKKTLLVLLISIFISCKKEKTLHKIKYQITFLEIPDWFNSNYIEVKASPVYQGEYNNSVNENGVPIGPYINYNQTKDGLWEYEYWELKDGDEVYFDLWAQLYYHYEVRIYIDNIEVSYKRVKISDSNYFEVLDLETKGMDNTPNNANIEFTFKE